MTDQDASSLARMTSALEEGRQAYIALSSKQGPHVTPELYAWSGGRLWFAAASSTLKAKVLPQGGQAGVLVSVPGRSVVLAGAVEVIDPRRPWSLVAGAHEIPATANALVQYTIRNLPDLLAFAGDALSGKLGWRVPPARVLFSLRPDRGMLLENDRITVSWGAWDVPSDAAWPEWVMPAGGEAAVVALPGAVAVPARWFAASDEVHLAPQLLQLLDLPTSFPVGVAVDEYSGPGPAAKRGVLLRGEASRTSALGGLKVDAERAVSWDGVDITTQVASGPGARPTLGATLAGWSG